MTVLGFDTSGKNASVAVSDGGITLANSSLHSSRTHSQIILPLCKSMLENAGLSLNDMDLFAVAAGPGSYTGLRIGIASVKAFAYALGKKCLGISTLEALAYNCRGMDGIICGVMTARADLVYSAFFRDASNGMERLCRDGITERGELAGTLSKYDEKIIFTGDGAERFLCDFNIPNAELAPLPLRLQLADGVCAAAFYHAPAEPSELRAAYLQPVKAEKDLEKKRNA